jgi:hypothetical protein
VPQVQASDIARQEFAGRDRVSKLTFECSTCGRFETLAVPIDPVRTDAVGWLASELRPPK